MRARALSLRIGVTAGALVYAVLAIGNGLDRLAVTRPGAFGQVPPLFANYILAIAGEAELRANPAAATALAEKLVARAPIEPFSAALLGASRAAGGDDAGADRAFRVAGQLGWRVPLTQSYWLAAALDAGDTGIAAQRLDALLRQRPELLRLPDTLAWFERDDAGRQALADRLAARPPWLDWYDGAIDPVPADIMAGRVPVLILLSNRGVVLGCAAITPALARLTGAGLTSEAVALRQRHCPEVSR